MSAYAELAVTTNFSFLRGASTAEELVLRAKELGLVGLGIADRNSVAGVVRAHAHGEGDRIQDRGRRASCFQRRLPRHSCLSGRSRRLGPPHAFADRRKGSRGKGRLHSWSSGFAGRGGGTQSHCHAAAADQCRARWSTCFAVSRKRPPAAPYGSRPACFIAAMTAADWQKLKDVADAAFVPLIAVNDVLYHVPERRALQDVVTCIREHQTLEEAGTSSGSQCRAASEISRRDGAAFWRCVQSHRPDDALSQALPVLVG